MMFEAVILAGGQGTRLKSVTGVLPKPMVDVNGTPFLYRLMQRLESQGCSLIVLSLCYRAEFIIECIQRDVPVKCKVEFAREKYPLDTGGAIKYASRFITAEKFVVLNGDTYSDISLKELFQYSHGCHLVITGVNIEDVSRYGTLELDDTFNVLSLNEKGRAGLGVINSGTYVITTSDIQAYPEEKFSFEQTYVENFKGVFKAFVSEGYFIDIGIPEDYHKLCRKII